MQHSNNLTSSMITKIFQNHLEYQTDTDQISIPNPNLYGGHDLTTYISGTFSIGRSGNPTMCTSRRKSSTKAHVGTSSTDTSDNPTTWISGTKEQVGYLVLNAHVGYRTYSDQTFPRARHVGYMLKSIIRIDQTYK